MKAGRDNHAETAQDNDDPGDDHERAVPFVADGFEEAVINRAQHRGQPDQGQCQRPDPGRRERLKARAKAEAGEEKQLARQDHVCQGGKG